MDRFDFMEFFRNDDKLQTLTTDDRMEVFRTILPGSGDITPKILNDILSDYSVTDLEVRKINPKSWKCRAEGACDVHKFVLLFLQESDYGFISFSMTQPNEFLPDVVFEFEVHEDLNYIRNVMKQVEDGHVMMQTLKPILEYTGIR